MTKRFTLEELFARDPTKNVPDKDYPLYTFTISHKADPAVVRVSLKILAGALDGLPIWASSHDARVEGDTFVQRKYDAIVKKLRSGEEIHRPFLHFSHGRVKLVDGRHRLYALMDEGFTHAEVVCDKHVEHIIKTMDGIDGRLKGEDNE